jgi:hypothetical protein
MYASLNEFARTQHYPLDVLVQIKKHLVDIYFIAMDMTYIGTAIPTNGSFSEFNYEGLMKGTKLGKLFYELIIEFIKIISYTLLGTHNLLTSSGPKDEIVIEFTTIVRLTGFLLAPPTVGYTDANRLNFSNFYYKDKSSEGIGNYDFLLITGDYDFKFKTLC